MKRQIFNIVLVHVARTWERLRIQQPHEEMPLDNIESVHEIESIATQIMKDEHIKTFIETQEADYFITHTNKMSDMYIEDLAEDIIVKSYLT